MFCKVVTLTLVLLVQITYQGKLMRRRQVMLISNQPKDSIGHEKSRKARQFGFFKKWFNSEPIKGHQNSHHKFSDIMNSIMSTPDYGLKYTEEKLRRMDIYPGFHNLIEVRGHSRYRYVPSKLKEFPMQQIQKLKNKLKSLKNNFKLQPRKTYELDDISYSREGYSIWENSHESYKRSSDSHLLKIKKHSTPLPKLHRHREYITKTVVAKLEVTPIPCLLNVVPFTNNDFFQRIDPYPFKEVKTRHQDPESDEEEEDERTKYSESY